MRAYSKSVDTDADNILNTADVYEEQQERQRLLNNIPVPNRNHSFNSKMKSHNINTSKDEYLIPLAGEGDGKSNTYQSINVKERESGAKESANGTKKSGIVIISVYAVINSIMCIPFLYGYASVIFNHPSFQPHINALSKLVLFSSFIHQMCFSIFSTLPFAIGQVQDAGLIFLSAMSNIIANRILEEGGTIEEILSTTIVLLGVATSSLGVVLIVMGKFRLADVVSYLPFPVVGGYLAFIGYFCVEAGVALCISKPMMVVGDWAQLFHADALLLAVPGIIAGYGFTLIARKCSSDFALPLAMVGVAASFYVWIFVSGMGMEGAREMGLLGADSPPTPFGQVVKMVDFSLVRWDLLSDLFSTWAGMVFVVSFSSCLDVAAISMDMGEALEVNTELTTVGISNLMSGLLGGFTGSYIFSQTLFTYRTGCHSRAVGFLVALSFLVVTISKVNALEIVPLFFLGSALVFIGFDLMYEWMIEVRHKLLLSEYIIVLVTFMSMLLVDINTGMLIGIIVAILEYVVANSRTSSLTKVTTRSLTTWNKEERKLLTSHGYRNNSPQILTFDVSGSIFFGSSIQLLTQICDEVGLTASKEDQLEISFASPRPSRSMPSPTLHTRMQKETVDRKTPQDAKARKIQPSFVVLNLTSVPNLDATAAQGCFLQLAKMCSRRNIILCAGGANTRVDWMLRSHNVAYNTEEELLVKDIIPSDSSSAPTDTKILLFGTIYEALEFCEIKLIEKVNSGCLIKRSNSGLSLTGLMPETDLASVFTHILGLENDPAQRELCLAFDSVHKRYHQNIQFRKGEQVFVKNSMAESFFIVLQGKVGCLPKENGEIANERVNAYLKTGGIFGYVDYILERPRSFTAVASCDGATVAKLTRAGLTRLKADYPDLDSIIDKVLLQTSVLELSNSET